MRVTPNFHFNGNCLEAIEVYKEVFGLEVVNVITNAEASSVDFIAKDNLNARVYHAEALLFGNRVMMTDDDKKIISNPLSLVITYDSDIEVKKAFELLEEGAIIIAPLQSTSYSSSFVSLIDRFGMRWELMTENTGD